MSEDTIKRSDVAEVVYKALKTPPLKGVLTDTMSLAIALVRDIPSADRPQGEWIPCSERLPNEGEVVLVCMRIESHKAEWEEQRSIEFGRIRSDRHDYCGTGWEWLNESGADYWQADWNHSILAWMPLPDPYESEEEGER